MSLLGLMSASIPVVHWGQLHMGALQYHLLNNWNRKVDSLEEVIHIPKEIRRSLTW